MWALTKSRADAGSDLEVTDDRYTNRYRRARRDVVVVAGSREVVPIEYVLNVHLQAQVLVNLSIQRPI